MATQTTNLGLTKPGYDEAADIVPAVNNNMDTLDAKMGAIPANSSVQGQLDSHTQAIGNLANLTTTEKGSLVGAANELNSKIASLFVEVKSGVISPNSDITVAYPTGYSNENAFAISYCMTNTAGTQKYYGSDATVALVPAGIVFTNHSSSNLSASAVIVKV